MGQTAVIEQANYLHISNEIHSVVSVNTHPTESNLPAFVKSSRQLEYNDKVHLSFEVIERFQPYYILIKGLIDFHRPKELFFSFDRVGSSFEVKVSNQDALKVIGFLQNVHSWLVQEVQFKTALKKVIAFEKQYNADRQALYGSLLGI